jgi:hypothetical protein
MGHDHDQGFYYPSGTGTSQGPQVSPSASACFEFDNPLTQGLSDLTARVNAMELHQEEIGHNLDHNTSLTHESLGMISSMHYDWHNGTYYPPPDPDKQS